MHQTIIARNVAARHNMLIDPNSQQRFRAVNGQRLDNSGSVIFNIEYQGWTTEVKALVSKSIKDEVLLSLRVLQSLCVIDSSFQNVREGLAKAAYQCGKTGHYKSICRSLQRPPNPNRYNEAPRQPSYSHSDQRVVYMFAGCR